MIPLRFRLPLHLVAFGRRPRALGRGVVLLALPLALAALLLFALAPAFSATERIPVAVVNLDRGATDGKGRAVAAGEDLVESLRQSEDLAWDFVSEDTADAGLAKGAYALILKIPRDYSKMVASLGSEDPQKATVEIVSDGAQNVLATRAGSAALRQVQSRLKSSLGREYLVSVLNDVRGEATRLSLTADGSVMLDSGYDALKQGADAVSSGLSQTASAAGQLTGGLDQIASGVTASGSGADVIAQGLDAVQRQVAQPLAQGAGALSVGLDQAGATARAMGQGVSGIGTALKTLQATLADANDDLASLMGAGTELARQGEELHGASASLQAALDQAQNPLQSLVSVGTAAAPALQQASGDSAALSAAISSDDQGSLKARARELQATLANLRAARDQVASAADASLPQDADATSMDAALETLDAQISALEGQVSALGEEADPTVEGSLAQRADAAAQSVAAASESISHTGQDAAALAPLAATVATSGKTATDALAHMGDTLEGQQQSLKNVAAALMGGQAILKGTNPVTGEAYDLAATASGLGQGVSMLGAQLSSEGAIGQGASGIAAGAGSLETLLTPFVGGTRQLAQGNGALGAALSAVSQGAGGLGQGLTAMSDAAGQIGTGVDQLKEASGKIADTMGAAGDKLAQAASDPADRASVASSPVTFAATQRHAVGASASLAPALIAAALWVGALLASFFLSVIDGRAIQIGHGVRSLFGCLGALILVGMAQAALMGVGAVALGVSVPGVFPFAVLLVAGSVSFAASAQAIRLLFGRAGIAVSLLMLVVQLLCAGALLPASFTSGWLSALGTVLPLPVLASGLRVAFAGGGAGVLVNMLVLVAWVALAIAVSLLSVQARQTVHPERV